MIVSESKHSVNKKANRLIFNEGRPKVTRTSQTNGVANITNKLDTVKQNLKNLALSYKGINNPRGFITDLSTALCANISNNPSNYVTATITVDNTPISISIRVSAHHANANNYPKGDVENLSLMISKRYKPNKFKANNEVKLSEYVYMGNKLETVESPFSQICTSLVNFLESGTYQDTTGIAFLNQSPQEHENSENNQEIKENKNMNKKTSIRLFERIAGEKGMNDAEVMRRRNDNFIKDMDSVPNSLWDNPYEPNYGDSVETNGWFETPEETQLKVAKDRLKRHRSTQNHKTNNEEIKENRNMNKKQTIRLNEQQLRQIVTESVKKVLNENKPPFLDSEFATGDHERCASYRITSVIREFTLKLRQAIIDDEYSDNIDKMFVIKIDQAIRKVLTEYGIPN